MKSPTHEKLTAEIMAVTAKIQTEFPEVYKLMSETPLFLSYADADITTAELKEYLSEIQKQLTTFRLNKILIKNV
jgi:hypothetical protein